MAVPAFEAFLQPVLATLYNADGDVITNKQMEKEMTHHFSLTPDDLALKTKKGNAFLISNRVYWATKRLWNAGLLDKPAEASFSINDEGRRTFEAKTTLTDGYLKNIIDKRNVIAKNKVNKKIKLWKISHGGNEFTSEEIDYFLKHNEVTVHATNRRKAFTDSLSVGDFFYLCYGSKKVLLIGKISSEPFENTEKKGWTSRHYTEIFRSVNNESYEGTRNEPKWTPSGNSSITQIRENQYNLFEETILEPFFRKKLSDLFRTEPSDDSVDYTEELLKDSISLSAEDYDEIRDLLQKKKNIILQGPPGVGKTYLAKRIAKAFIGINEPDRIALVQFHQGYTYEEFIIGLRPTPTGSFEPEPGFFKKLCERATNGNGPYFLIIDEINRGNISAIFGEALMLIENSHRKTDRVTIGFGQELTVPENLYIIGTMNTADRSIAMMDYALRRRFAFKDLEPNFERLRETTELAEDVLALITKVETLNDKLRKDSSFGPGYCIGHSFFMNGLSADEIVKYELAPLIYEYWFDDRKTAESEIKKLTVRP